MIADYLSAEPAIVERLKDQVPELRKVEGATELAAITERDFPNLQTPAAYVVYAGDRVGGGTSDSARQGRDQVVQQVWAVVLAVRNVREVTTGAAIRAQAGPLITAVLSALAGWEPIPELRALRRIQGAGPVWGKGVAFFELRFEAQLITS